MATIWSDKGRANAWEEENKQTYYFYAIHVS